MQKKQTKKLALNRQTIRALNDDALDSIAGGCNDTITCDISMCYSCCPRCLIDTIRTIA